jgi:HNH endonuclease
VVWAEGLSRGVKPSPTDPLHASDEKPKAFILATTLPPAHDMSKLQTKRRGVDARCAFCGESDPVVLDCHRIQPGSEGGRYQWHNTLSTCANDHRRIHAASPISYSKKKFPTVSRGVKIGP